MPHASNGSMTEKATVCPRFYPLGGPPRRFRWQCTNTAAVLVEGRTSQQTTDTHDIVTTDTKPAQRSSSQRVPMTRSINLFNFYRNPPANQTITKYKSQTEDTSCAPRIVVPPHPTPTQALSARILGCDWLGERGEEEHGSSERGLDPLAWWKIRAGTEVRSRRIWRCWRYRRSAGTLPYAHDEGE